MREMLLMNVALALAQAEAAPALAEAPPVAAPDKATGKKDPDKRICKSYSVIGSLVATQRECHTAAEWRRINSATDADIRERFRARGGSNGPGM